MTAPAVHAVAEVRHAAAGKATVTPVAGDGCGPCRSGRGCGAGLWSARGQGASGEGGAVALDDPFGLAPGDRVLVAVSLRELMGAVATVFLLPLLGFLGGASVGQLLAPILLNYSAGRAEIWTDSVAATGALGGLGVGLCAARLLSRRRGAERARIVRKLGDKFVE